MKRGLIITSTLIAGTAFAGTASIITSFKSPVTYVQGIDYHGGYIYHSAPRTTIFKTTTIGSVVQKIYADPTRAGLDRTDIEFWTAGPISKAIFRLSTTGSWIGTIPMPTTGRGISFGEGFLWFTGNDTRIYKVTTKGAIVTSFRIQTPPGYINPRGICYYGGKLWLVDSNIGAITQATISGSFIESYSTAQDPYGVTCEGNYIWYSDLISGWIYKMLPITSTVTPASLGKVKALYR